MTNLGRVEVRRPSTSQKYHHRETVVLAQSVAGMRFSAWKDSSSGHHDKQVQVWRVGGQPGQSRCCMPQVWETLFQGSRSKEDTCQSVSRSRGSGS